MSDKKPSSLKIFDVVQLIAAIAIVMSLGLVIWELRQTQTLALGNIYHEYWSETLENKRVLLGEDPAAVIAKGCSDPASLSPGEREIVRAALDIQFIMLDRSRTIETVVEFGLPWEEAAIVRLRSILSSPIGRYDYEMFGDHEERWPSVYRPYIEEILKEEYLDCGYFWNDFEVWLKDNQQVERGD